MIDNTMFCYQCEQTARGAACTTLGMCGKDARVAALQDLLVYQLEGIAYYGDSLLKAGLTVSPQVHYFVISALFSTLTNVNFDAERFYSLLAESSQVKAALRAQAGPGLAGPLPAAAGFVMPEGAAAMQAAAERINIRPQAALAPDLQSLKDTLLYGAKGMAAYAQHAWALGYRDDAVNACLHASLAALLDDTLDAGALLGLLLELGKVNLKCMQMLDQANTGRFGHPEPTQVPATIAADGPSAGGPFIVVSGHDLADLAQLLEQTAGTGVRVYTHGEMLPANAYPGLKKYPHLAGNYGGAWQLQQRDFDGLPGAILMTTNCLIEPRASYNDRLFTTGAVGWPGVPHIDGKAGVKDFTAVIRRARELGGYRPGATASNGAALPSLTIGFGHNTILSHAASIVEAVKAGQIKHFFLVGGCDGAKPGRNYYTQFAEATPKDSLMLTLGCGKYRINKADYGTVAGFPRLLDVGQCNDAYSAIRVAGALAEAFNCGVKDLPLTLVLSWFEQKAVCILLSLLALGIKNIYIGPSLPAFLTPNVLKLLVETYELHPLSTPEADLAAMLA